MYYLICKQEEWQKKSLTLYLFPPNHKFQPHVLHYVIHWLAISPCSIQDREILRCETHTQSESGAKGLLTSHDSFPISISGCMLQWGLSNAYSPYLSDSPLEAPNLTWHTQETIRKSKYCMVHYSFANRKVFIKIILSSVI